MFSGRGQLHNEVGDSRPKELGAGGHRQTKSLFGIFGAIIPEKPKQPSGVPIGICYTAAIRQLASYVPADYVPIGKSGYTRCPVSENRTAADAAGSRFSPYTSPCGKYHTNPFFGVLSLSVPIQVPFVSDRILRYVAWIIVHVYPSNNAAKSVLSLLNCPY
jgi:hypothetical protein